MAITLSRHRKGGCSLEFEPEDRDAVLALIEARYGDLAMEHGGGPDTGTYRFGGAEFIYYDAWDDPCLIAVNAHGRAVLRQLATDAGVPPDAPRWPFLRPLIGLALLLFAPFAVLSLLLLLTGPHLGQIIYLWLALSYAAGAAGLWLIGLPNWLRLLFALGYAALVTVPLIFWTLIFGCSVYGLCP